MSYIKYFNNLKFTLIEPTLYNNKHIKGETNYFNELLKHFQYYVCYGFVINKSLKYECNFLL